MLRRLALTLLPVPLAFAASAWASARVADRAGAHGAVALDVLAKLVRMPPALVAPEIEQPIPTDAPVIAAPLTAPDAHSGKSGKKAKPAPTPVVFVSRKAVLNLANTGARPHGAPVPATAYRPAGLRLAGVAALGIGLSDGDVLTRAVGQPALSTGAVIQAVLAARAKHAPVLEGEFWRGPQRFVIRVEQPYIDERRSDVTDGGGERAISQHGAESG